MGSSLSRSDLFILFSSHKITAGGDLFISIFYSASKTLKLVTFLKRGVKIFITPA